MDSKRKQDSVATQLSERSPKVESDLDDSTSTDGKTVEEMMSKLRLLQKEIVDTNWMFENFDGGRKSRPTR